MIRITLQIALALVAAGLWAPAVGAAPPDHPVITEVYQDPPPLDGDDGPVLRDPANSHQSFIEIWLPPALGLRAGLNKDALRLAFYEVEGDWQSSGAWLVNYRIDLPTFDLDTANGITPGAVPRPATGVVVIGWVDYVGNPPTDLAGTPSTRLGLVNGGITASPPEYTFVAMNGAQFTGTTNFPVPAAESLIHMPNEAVSGIVQNGSGVYLLVDRDDLGYVELYDDKDTAHVPPLANADPALPLGTVLQLSALLDGWATNEENDFLILEQPQPATGFLDNEGNLPPGGAYSDWIPQLDGSGAVGHERIYLDLIAKTTEDGVPGNEDPAVDATGLDPGTGLPVLLRAPYINLNYAGPLGLPSPGIVHMSSNPPSLSVGDGTVQQFDVLAGSISTRPGIWAANEGGDYAITTSATPGPSSDPSVVSSTAPGSPAVVSLGQTLVHPSVEIALGPGAVAGASATAPVSVAAANVNGGDPPVQNPLEATVATFNVIDPQTGLDALGLPLLTTSLAALQGLPPDPGRPNEFSATSLASFVAANLGAIVGDERGNGLALITPTTDFSDPVLLDAFEDDMPDGTPLGGLFINFPGPDLLLGTADDLVNVVANSAEVASGARTYDGSFNLQGTLLKAVEFTIAETRTAGGSFVPSERVHFANAGGRAGESPTGLTDVLTGRGFEIALVDHNLGALGVLETGQADDFGVLVEVGRVRAGAPAGIVPGRFLHLSWTGGLEGADIDSVDVPPHGNRTVVIYLDLDTLDSVLGVETITRLFVVDGNGGSEINVIEAFSLNVDNPLARCGDANVDDVVNDADLAAMRLRLTDPIANPFPPGGDALCNISGAASPACDLLDTAILHRVLATPWLPPGIDSACPGGI